MGLLCSYVAKQKNRDGVNWFALGLIFNIFALLALIALPAGAVLLAGQKKCKYCAETIKNDALICRYCQRDVSTSDSTEAVDPDALGVCPICSADIVVSATECGNCTAVFGANSTYKIKVK